MNWKLASLMSATLAFTVLAYAQENPAELEGYRTDTYRAAVPATLTGARVLSTEEAEAIWRTRSGIFIDVLPRPPKPARSPPTPGRPDPKPAPDAKSPATDAASTSAPCPPQT